MRQRAAVGGALPRKSSASDRGTLRQHARLLLLQLAGRLLPPGQAPAQLPGGASILVIRPDHLGDLLLAAPAVALLRGSLPGARLTYLVGPWGEEAARRGPPVDEVVTCRFPGFTRQSKPSPLQPYRLLLAEAARLGGRFQAALVMRPDHWWGALLAALARIPLRLGYGVSECAPLLTHALPWPSRAEAPPGNLEQVNAALVRRLLELAPRAEVSATAESPLFRVLPEERAFAAALAAEDGLGAGQPLVALHPGSGAVLKGWPVNRWIEVGSALAARFDARVLVTGSEEELPLADQVARGIGASAASVAGRTSLGQLAALLELAQCALGPDCGPMHLAAAMGTPTVRLFGPTDPRLFMPLGRSDQVALTVELPCRPCGRLEQPPCGARLEPACLMGIGVEQVVAAASTALGAGPGASA